MISTRGFETPFGTITGAWRESAGSARRLVELWITRGGHEEPWVGHSAIHSPILWCIGAVLADRRVQNSCQANRA